MFTGDLKASEGVAILGRVSAVAAAGTYLNSIPGHYLILDPQLRIVDATDAYLRATMTEREEIVGRGLFEVFPDSSGDADANGEDDLRDSLARVIRTHCPDSLVVQKHGMRAPADPGGDLESRHLNLVNTPVIAADGTLSHIVHQAVDVTGFVNFRAEAEEQRQSIQELRSKLESTRAANEAKNMFLSRMSHELRSPLNAVIGYSELLQLDGTPGTEDMHAAESIFRAGAHLLELINEVLDITRVESGNLSMSIEPVSTEAAIQSAVELMTPFADGAGIALDLPEKPCSIYVKADPQRLVQVLVNLLSNAIKYNRPNGRVSVGVTEPSAGYARLIVSDTGIGIAEHNLRRLFQPFERLGAEATGIEGTGLGLSLTRALVWEMGGRIDVESEVGKGSRFSVELASIEPALLGGMEGDDSAALSVVEYPKQRTLLYIEDTAANVKLVERILQRRPRVNLIAATVGALGIEIARERAPDMVLLDLHLPDVSGSEVLARLKADELTRDTPVVVLSADATDHQRSEVLALGASAYLMKPIRIAELLRAVDEILA